MKPFRAKVLDAFINREHTHYGDSEGTTIAVQAAQSAGEVLANDKAGPTPNRRQRRRNEKFNRMLSKRLKKDGVPATVTVQPDGGIHVDVKVEQEEKKE